LSPQIYDKSGNIVGSIGEHPFGTEMGNLQNMEKAIPRVGLGSIASAALFGVFFNSLINMAENKRTRKSQMNVSKNKIEKHYIMFKESINTLIGQLDEGFPIMSDEIKGNKKKKLSFEINFLHKFHNDLKLLLAELENKFESLERKFDTRVVEEILNLFSDYENSIPEFQKNFNAIAKEMGWEMMEFTETKSNEINEQTSEDAISNLERLFSLKESGAITEEEYQNLKSKYL
jgi:hypothetical protein